MNHLICAAALLVLANTAAQAELTFMTFAKQGDERSTVALSDQGDVEVKSGAAILAKGKLWTPDTSEIEGSDFNDGKTVLIARDNDPTACPRFKIKMWGENSAARIQVKLLPEDPNPRRADGACSYSAIEGIYQVLPKTGENAP